MSNIDHQLDQLPHHTPDILWNRIRYESGRYDCRVERNGDHGQLIVTLVGLYHDHILHEEPVKIDRLDIDAWRIRSVSVICKPEAPLEGSVTANAGGELTGDRETPGNKNSTSNRAHRWRSATSGYTTTIRPRSTT